MTVLAVHYAEVLFFFSSRRRHTRCSRDWSSDVCSSDLLHYAKDIDGITLEVRAPEGASGQVSIDFQPAISLRAKVLGVTLNGRGAEFHVETSSVDQHVLVLIPLSTGPHSLRIRLQDDFGLTYHSTLPVLGASSEGLRIVSETWSPSRDRLTLGVSGLARRQYRLSAWTASQIVFVSGAH